ncbi:MAG: hypothetical protein BroJett029_03940 [Alphaproteobacteria bacterium]|nr:MAG: hypothetical protein BroJett029_03940 [Alphaproteobacteria bacterium]
MAAFPEDGPDGPDLLDVARRRLVDELLPLLPADRRLDVLMIANATGIAARESRSGESELRAALARLAALYDQAEEASSVDDARDRLSLLNRRLAADIRAGVFDAGPKRGALTNHLRATTRARLAITNPKVLE